MIRKEFIAAAREIRVVAFESALRRLTHAFSDSECAPPNSEAPCYLAWSKDITKSIAEHHVKCREGLWKEVTRG